MEDFAVFKKAMKEAKNDYFKSQLASFYFSFDLDQDGLIDDYEMARAYEFWSSEDQSE